MPRRYAREDLKACPWSTDELISMDNAFTEAMKREGREVTEPSSRFGTRSPIAGYRRD